MDGAVAELAHGCALMAGARGLSAWVGRGRPAGVGAVLRAESGDEHRIGAAVVCRATLGVLDTASISDLSSLRVAVEYALERLPERERSAGYCAFGRDRLAETGAMKLLAECGAISRPAMEVTPLGRGAYDEFADPVASAPRWGDDEVLQLKIGLDRVRPPVWRRVLMPAGMSVADLHHVIQIVLDWDGDHLHVFTVNGICYSDPTYELMECADENLTSLASALPRLHSSISYRYDLGDCWNHTITLEKVLPHDPDQRYPTCTAGRGDAPVEDSDQFDQPEPPPFRLDDVDARLATLDHRAHRH